MAFRSLLPQQSPPHRSIPTMFPPTLLSPAVSPTLQKWARCDVPYYHAISERSSTSKLPCSIVPSFSVSPTAAISCIAAAPRCCFLLLCCPLQPSYIAVGLQCRSCHLCHLTTLHAASSLHSLSLRPFPLRAVLLLHKLFLPTTVSLRGLSFSSSIQQAGTVRLFFSASASTDAAGPSPVRVELQ